MTENMAQVVDSVKNVIGAVSNGPDGVGVDMSKINVEKIAELLKNALSSSKSAEKKLGEEVNATQEIKSHLTYLSNKIEKSDGSGSIQIPVVTEMAHETESIDVASVMQKVSDILLSDGLNISAVITVVNDLVDMLVKNDTKGLGFFLSKEAQKVIAQTPLADIRTALSDLEKQIDLVGDISESSDLWKDKLKLSLLSGSFKFSEFKNQNSSKLENMSEKNKKIEYLESSLQPGDILYLNEPNEEKSTAKQAVVHLAKEMMIDADDGSHFTTIHTAVYVGNGEIRHIRRNDNGEMGEKNVLLKDLFIKNEESDIVYSSVAVGRMHLSPQGQELFSKSVIEKSKSVESYSDMNAISSALTSFIGVDSEIDVNDDSMICTELPRISALILLNENESGVISLSDSDTKELEKLVHTNSAFDMFTKLKSPLAMNIKDFTANEVTEHFENNL